MKIPWNSAITNNKKLWLFIAILVETVEAAIRHKSDATMRNVWLLPPALVRKQQWGGFKETGSCSCNTLRWHGLVTNASEEVNSIRLGALHLSTRTPLEPT